MGVDMVIKDPQLKKDIVAMLKSMPKGDEGRMADGIIRIIKEWYQAGFQDGGQITENTSDGYHTFKELYEFRLLYNAAFLNALYELDGNLVSTYNVHKSRRHYEGDLCFGGGWFIVMADLPTGQISNHYEEKDWDLFDIPEREKADKWDGHTAADVAKRLRKFLEEKDA